MRRSPLRVTALAVLTLGVAAACETEGTTSPLAATNRMEATVDGVAWTANLDVGLGRSIGVFAGGAQQQVELRAGNTSSTPTGNLGRVLLLRIQNFQGPGTYVFGTPDAGPTAGPSFAVLLLYVPTRQAPIAEYATVTAPAGSGTVVVTAWDSTTRRIAGTFAFRGVAGTPDSVTVVSGGSFDGALLRATTN